MEFSFRNVDGGGALDEDADGSSASRRVGGEGHALDPERFSVLVLACGKLVRGTRSRSDEKRREDGEEGPHHFLFQKGRGELQQQQQHGGVVCERE